MYKNEMNYRILVTNNVLCMCVMICQGIYFFNQPMWQNYICYERRKSQCSQIKINTYNDSESTLLRALHTFTMDILKIIRCHNVKKQVWETSFSFIYNFTRENSYFFILSKTGKYIVGTEILFQYNISRISGYVQYFVFCQLSHTPYRPAVG